MAVFLSVLSINPQKRVLLGPEGKREEALEGAMKALNDAYWIAKAKNKKYAPKKYRKSEEPAE